MAAAHTGDTTSWLGEEAGQCQQMRLLLDRVGEKWSLLVVLALRGPAQRFNALRRQLPGVSPRMLARTVKGLERDGLVHRTVHPTVPPQVDYALTTLGRSLLEPMDVLLQWAREHTGAMDAARVEFDAREGRSASS